MWRRAYWTHRALLAISVSRPLFLQKICETKKKVRTKKVNSNTVAKSGDKEGNTELLDSCIRLLIPSLTSLNSLPIVVAVFILIQHNRVHFLTGRN